METIQEALKKLTDKLVPDVNRHLFNSLCSLLDRLGVSTIEYNKADDTYDIAYEDGRSNYKSIFIRRKDITCQDSTQKN